MPEPVLQAYEAAVEAALSLPFAASVNKHGEAELTLHPDARELSTQFREWLEPQLLEFGPLGHMADFAQKCKSYTFRLAGLLHCMRAACEAPLDPCPAEISATTMAAAVALTRYYLSHARVACARMGADAKATLAERIVRWLLEERRLTFTRRETQRRVLNGQADEDGTLDAALKALEEDRIIREKAAPEKRGQGRPPKTYDVNPRIFRGPGTTQEGGERDA